MRPYLRKSMLALSFGLLAYGVTSARAQTCPDDTRHLIVGYSAGGTGDIVAAAIADALSQQTKQRVVIDHVPGASGVVAAKQVASAAADGCTLLIGQTAEIAVTPAITRNPPYDLAKDLQPIALLATVPLALVVSAKSPYASFADLAKALRSSGPALVFASAGRATPGYFAGELLRLRTRATLAHVAYDGGGAALQAVLDGKAALYFPALPTAMEQLQKEQLRILAVTSSQRSPAEPEVPTMEELGLSPFQLDLWVGVFAPHGVHQEQAAELNRQFNAALLEPKVRPALLNKGASVAPMTVPQFTAFVKAETARYANLIDTEFCATCPW